MNIHRDRTQRGSHPMQTQPPPSVPLMDENTAPQRESEERKHKRRQTETSRNEKQRMGVEAFLQEKRDAEKE